MVLTVESRTASLGTVSATHVTMESLRPQAGDGVTRPRERSFPRTSGATVSNLNPDKPVTPEDWQKLAMFLLQQVGGSVSIDSIEMQRIQDLRIESVEFLEQRDPWRLIVRLGESK